MPTTRANPAETARRGVGLVLAELTSRGLKGTPGSGREHNNIEVVRADGSCLLVRVKTKRTGTWQSTTTEADPDPVRDPSRFVVFVDMPDVAPPQYFVVPEWEYKREIHLEHTAYLKRNPGHERPDNVTHHKITKASVVGHRGRWDLITRTHA